MHNEMLSPQIEAAIWDTGSQVTVERDFGEGHPIVYYLTEATGNQGAFDGSVRLLEKLIKIAGIRLVCLEGGSGPIPPLKESKQQSHLPKSHQSYEVALSEALRNPPEFYGVDDPGRYQFAIRAMKSLLPARRPWAAMFARLSRELSRSARRELSPGFSNLLAALRRCKGNFSEELRHLRSFAEQAGMPVNRYKEIEVILSMTVAESKIDFRRANVEFKNLVGRIHGLLLTHPLLHILDAFDYSATGPGRSSRQTKLHEAAPSELPIRDFWRTAIGRAVQRELGGENVPTMTSDNLAKAFSRVLEGISSSYDLRDLMTQSLSPRYRRFLLLMYRSASLFGIPMEEYGNIQRYIQYLNRFHETTPESILRELGHLRRAVIKSTILTDLDRLFNEVINQLEIVSLLFTLSATSGDIKRIHDFSGDIHHHSLCQTLSSFIEGSESLRALKGVSREYEHCLAKALDFYAEMPLRSQRLAINAISTMLQKQQTEAVLITGGFHAEEVSENLTLRKISHLVLNPRVERVTSSAELEAYFGRITTQLSEKTA